MSGLRIAFAGASGTGKTTLAEYTSKFLDVPLNPVGARSIAREMGYDSPYDVDKAGRRAEFQRKLLHAKVAWEERQDSFATDRTVADNLCYTAIHDVHAVDEEVLSLVAVGLKRYTHIFLCTMEGFFELQADPNRVRARAYHALYERLLMGLLLAREARGVVHVIRERELEARKAVVGKWVGAR